MITGLLLKNSQYNLSQLENKAKKLFAASSVFIISSVRADTPGDDGGSSGGGDDDDGSSSSGDGGSGGCGSGDGSDGGGCGGSGDGF